MWDRETYVRAVHASYALDGSTNYGVPIRGPISDAMTEGRKLSNGRCLSDSRYPVYCSGSPSSCWGSSCYTCCGSTCCGDPKFFACRSNRCQCAGAACGGGCCPAGHYCCNGGRSCCKSRDTTATNCDQEGAAISHGAGCAFAWVEGKTDGKEWR